MIEAERAAPSDPALNQVNGFLAQLGPWRQIRPDRAEGLERAKAFFALLGDPQNAVPDRARRRHRRQRARWSPSSPACCAPMDSGWVRTAPRMCTHWPSGSRSTVHPSSPELLLRALAAVRPAAEQMSESRYGAPSFFEATNAIAFHAFADQVDYSVIEAGIGGLYDSTNTITRGDKLAVITAIGLDHTEILGSTLAQIAAQKAGILPVGGRAVIARPQMQRSRRRPAGRAGPAWLSPWNWWTWPQRSPTRSRPAAVRPCGCPTTPGGRSVWSAATRPATPTWPSVRWLPSPPGTGGPSTSRPSPMVCAASGSPAASNAAPCQTADR